MLLAKNQRYIIGYIGYRIDRPILAAGYDRPLSTRVVIGHRNHEYSWGSCILYAQSHNHNPNPALGAWIFMFPCGQSQDWSDPAAIGFSCRLTSVQCLRKPRKSVLHSYEWYNFILNWLMHSIVITVGLYINGVYQLRLTFIVNPFSPADYGVNPGRNPGHVNPVTHSTG